MSEKRERVWTSDDAFRAVFFQNAPPPRFQHFRLPLLLPERLRRHSGDPAPLEAAGIVALDPCRGIARHGERETGCSLFSSLSLARSRSLFFPSRAVREKEEEKKNCCRRRRRRRRGEEGEKTPFTLCCFSLASAHARFRRGSPSSGEKSIPFSRSRRNDAKQGSGGGRRRRW